MGIDGEIQDIDGLPVVEIILLTAEIDDRACLLQPRKTSVRNK
jgi:hypothetical protein